jgi:hypothetical protein
MRPIYIAFNSGSACWPRLHITKLKTQLAEARARGDAFPSWPADITVKYRKLNAPHRFGRCVHIRHNRHRTGYRARHSSRTATIADHALKPDGAAWHFCCVHYFAWRQAKLRTKLHRALGGGGAGNQLTRC